MTFIQEQQQMASDIFQKEYPNRGSVIDVTDEVVKQTITNTINHLLAKVDLLEKKYESDELAKIAGMEDLKLNALNDVREKCAEIIAERS